jgi:PncC family amidohydrolase
MFNETVIRDIKNQMLRDQQTIAVAESVTAGYLQAALASAENASMFFQGGISVYNLGQKARHLKIEPIHADSCNCVSPKVAEEMALEVTKLFSSHWGIAITGYATPMPECSIENPFAYYAISFGNRLLAVKKVDAEKGNPADVQIFYVNKILTDFSTLLEHQSSFSSSDLNSISSR